MLCRLLKKYFLTITIYYYIHDTMRGYMCEVKIQHTAPAIKMLT